MRPIKFRGINEDIKGFVEGKLIYNNVIAVTDKMYNFKNQYIGDHREEYKVLGETVGQFTGLFDKNKKEVFEGDIIKVDYYYPDNNYSDEPGDHGHWTGSIIYQPSKGFMAKSRSQHSDYSGETWKINGYRNFSCCRTQVIGNIHGC